MQTLIHAVGTAVPPHAYTQEEVARLAGYRRGAIRSLFLNSGIQTRHLALPPDHRLQTDPNWFARHYAEWSVRLGAEAARQALERAGSAGSEIDYVVASSCTGYLCPGISQRIARELGARPTTKTANLVGMGCNAAIPALERATEFAERHPGSTVLVVAAEIGSAAYWIDETDLETAVGNAIFSDGAAAAVIRASDSRDAGVNAAGGFRGERRVPLPRLEAFESRTHRELIDLMGFLNEDGRLRVRLSREVPTAVLPIAEQLLARLFETQKLTPSDIQHWIVHPGGKRVLELVGEKWGLEKRLDASWDVLARYGNMSSATVLFVLEPFVSGARVPLLGETALMLGMGPGLSVEGALLRWV